MGAFVAFLRRRNKSKNVRGCKKKKNGMQIRNEVGEHRTLMVLLRNVDSMRAKSFKGGQKPQD